MLAKLVMLEEGLVRPYDVILPAPVEVPSREDWRANWDLGNQERVLGTCWDRTYNVSQLHLLSQHTVSISLENMIISNYLNIFIISCSRRRKRIPVRMKTPSKICIKSKLYLFIKLSFFHHSDRLKYQIIFTLCF